MGQGKRKRQKTEWFFQQRYNYWLTRIIRLASSSIKWDGLPKYIDTIRLENILNRSGSAIIGYDEITDRYYMAQNSSTGNIDINGYPMDRKGMFANGEDVYFTPETSVIIYNNSMRMADLWVYELFAREMADYDSAIAVNMNSQKTMPIIPTTQEQMLSVENAYVDLQNNIPYVLVEREGFDIQSFKDALLFDNRKSFTSDLMITVEREIWNRCLTFIGINNVNVEKRERVNVQETVSNLDEILFMRRDRLNAREFACQQMEDIFGWDVSVEYYSEGGVTTNGNIYNIGTDNSRTRIYDIDEEPGYRYLNRNIN